MNEFMGVYGFVHQITYLTHQLRLAVDGLFFGFRRFASRMCTLISCTHNGNIRGDQGIMLIVSNKISASTIPRKAIQRGMIPVRSDRVQVEILNTPAIFIA